MTKLLSGLESEKLWVDNHSEYYDNVMHQELVKVNIEIHYSVQEMINRLNKVIKEK